jgi:hypothetical protein
MTVLREHKASVDLVLKVPQVKMEHKVLQVTMVLREHRVLVEHKAQQVHKEHLD